MTSASALTAFARRVFGYHTAWCAARTLAARPRYVLERMRVASPRERFQLWRPPWQSPW